MNVPELNRKLVEAARRAPLDDRVPYAFEKRVMAHLAHPAGVSRPDVWAAFIRQLWYGAAACAVVAFLLNVWSIPQVQDEDHAFSNGVEDCLMDAVDDAGNIL